MVHDIRLAPLRSVRTRTLRPLGHAGVQEEVIKRAAAVPAEFLERLLGEGPDALEARQLEGQDRDGAARGAVELELVVGLPGRLGVSRPYDEPVWLGLGEELSDYFETLVGWDQWEWEMSAEVLCWDGLAVGDWFGFPDHR